MKLPSQEPTELIPLNLIRSETALTRYPIHRLAKKGSIRIELKEENEKGKKTFLWKVSHNSEYGQPGPLAYKIDTLVINRKIEESGNSIPAYIKLGSLRDITEQLGLAESGKTKADIKKALHQNASAYITAKIRYQGKDRTERTAEFGDTRYGVVFTGEKLPDGREADAVYIIPHDWYKELLESAVTRPLDYDYLKELAPTAQRLYELLSFQIYGAIEGERRRAKLLYSEFCTFAPQTRYFDFGHVKKQMYKLNVPHRKSGYIAAVHFQETTDTSGQRDWEMFYTPGLKAVGEHTAAKKRPKRKRPIQLELPTVVQEKKTTPDDLTPEQEGFLQKLTGRGVTKTEARRLVTHRLDACRLKVPALDHLPETQGKTNRGGNVRAFIERDEWQLPPAYLEAQKKALEVARAEARRRAVEACTLCESTGFRFVKDENNPQGAMRRCSHDPKIESKTPNAL